MSPWDGAVVVPFLSAEIEQARDVARWMDLGGPYFQSRKAVAPVAPSEPALLAENPIIILATIDSLRADLMTTPK